MKKNVISSTSAPPQKRMHAHVWFEGYSVLLLHGAARSNTVYEKRLISSVKQLSIKSGTESGGKNYSKVGVVLRVNNEVVVKIWMTKRCTADYSSTSLHGLAYFVIHAFSLIYQIHPSACFVGVCQYVAWMINFLCIQLHRKSSLKFYRRERGFMKNVAVTFSVPKSIYKWTQTNLCINWWKIETFEALFCCNQRFDKNRNWTDCFFS